MDNKKLKSRLSGKLQAMQTKPTAEATVDTLSVATVASTEMSEYVALTSNALSIINENLKNQQLSHALFDIVKSPSGGTTTFTVPGLAGDEVHKELIGIVLDYNTPRAYWDSPDPIEGTPPVCYSRDSIVSVEGQPCSTCHFNDFGSKDGDSNGKACKESVHIFLLRPDNILPIIVRIPVSSKALFLKYATRLISSLTPINGVVTKITLKKVTSNTGKPYAQYNFESVKKLNSEEAITAKAFGQKFMEILSNVPEQDLKEAV